jgi:8-oxo-dGTP pyrophosphatase MutT (NUDIX family)
VARLAVKLLVVDESDRLLLIHSKAPQSQAEYWYPVGGGVEAGETLQEAAAREAYEETGLVELPPGRLVWRRDHTYEFGGRTLEVHEEWLLHMVDRFDPAPAMLSDYESHGILGFRWWRAEELVRTSETVFPPQLGHHLTILLTDGVPAEPIDLTYRWRPAQVQA